MSDNDSNFAKYIPGFDFLQNLAKSTSQAVPQMPNLANWIAPTLSEEELEKRIAELKAVHFWLDQNAKALSATVQALEVQKMTLATLKGMNFNMGDVANAFKLKAADTVAAGVQKVTEKAAATVKTVTEVAEKTEKVAKKVSDTAKPAATAAVAGLADPMQLWHALTQQFQTIAASAMKEAGKTTAIDASKNLARGVIKAATKSTTTKAKSAPIRRAVNKRVAEKKSANKPASTRR